MCDNYGCGFLLELLKDQEFMKLTPWLEEEDRSGGNALEDTNNKPHNNNEKHTKNYNDGDMTRKVNINKEV